MADSQRRFATVFAAASVVGFAIVLGLGLWVAAEGTRSACDEPVPGTTSAAGCDFLANGGYNLIRVIPVAVFIVVAGVAWRARRVGLVVVGFVLAFALLAVAMAVEPGDYPWL